MRLMDRLRAYHADLRPGWRALDLAESLRDQFSSSFPEPMRPSRHAAVALRAAPPPRVLICDRIVPTPDRDSGSQRMDWIVRLLAPMCSAVTFVPSSAFAFPEYALRLRQAGVEVVFGTHQRFGRLMRSREGTYDLVLLSGIKAAHSRLSAVRRFQPAATVIFDTVDLKSLRLERETLETGRSRDGTPARQRSLEEQLIRASDVTATTSEHEARLLRVRSPEARTIVLPNVHEVPDRPVPDFSSRRGLMFIGSFTHAPNAHGVHWFTERVLPLIRRRIDVELIVVGAAASAATVAEWGPHVRYAGWLADVLPVFDGARVCVAPLRYGAGMKGKVGQAMSLGLPVVTTSIGAEGMGLVDDRDVLIRDEAGAFADAVVLMHEDPNAWARLSAAARLLVAERWTPDAMRARLQQLLHEAAGHPNLGAASPTRIAAR